MKTLLIEDNPADARLIQEMLKEHATSTFEVRHVTRLDTALERLREETFDVLLLDLGLPDSQGMDTLAVTHKAWGCLPIVVLTGLDDELFALQVMRAGAQDYLVKGRFDTELLVRTIRYAVKRKQAEDEVRRLNAELEMRVAERTRQLQAANEELQKELLVRWQAEMALRANEERLRTQMDRMPIGCIVFDRHNCFNQLNPAAEHILGYAAMELCGQHANVIVPETHRPHVESIMRRLAEGDMTAHSENENLTKNGATIFCQWTNTPLRDGAGNFTGFLSMVQDITERKQAEEERQISIDFLAMVNRSRGTKTLLQAATAFLQQRSGCEAVGIRLREGEDFPYFETRGFPQQFVASETKLCARDLSGNIIRDDHGDPVIECMCGNVICGRFEPSKPFFTTRGSFWSNGTTDMLARSTEADRQSGARNRCNGAGYESVALIPLHDGEERFGLLQLNDRRKGRFSAESIALWERLAVHLATAISKFKADEALEESEEQFRVLTQNLASAVALIEASGEFSIVNKSFLRLFDLDEHSEPPNINSRDWSRWRVFDESGRLLDVDEHPVRQAVLTRKAVRDQLVAMQPPASTDRKWLLISAEPILDGQGNIQHVICTYTDITERRLAEAQIAHLASFPELNPTLIFETDSDGGITYLNPSLRRMFPALEVEGLKHPLLRDWPSAASSASAGSAKAVLREVQVDGLVLLQHLYTPEPGVVRAYCLDITERKRAEEAILRGEMEAYQREQMRALAGKLSEAREQERKRVALDLHDDIGQLLAAIKMDLAWTKRHLTGANDDVKERLERSIGMIGDSARSLRRICSDLRPGILDDVGLPAAIEWRANEFASRTGIDCEVIVPSTELPIDNSKSTAIFRIFEECLTNVMRHAEAKSVRVSLRAEDGDVFLSVQDDGVGFRESSVSNSMESLGLLGMKERAQACGGEVIVTSSPGHGTTVTIRVPNTQPVPVQPGVD